MAPWSAPAHRGRSARRLPPISPPWPGRPRTRMATTSPPTIAPVPHPVASPAASPWLLALTSLIGLGAFFYPFLFPPDRSGETSAHAADTPLLLTVLVGL